MTNYDVSAISSAQLLDGPPATATFAQLPSAVRGTVMLATALLNSRRGFAPLDGYRYHSYKEGENTTVYIWPDSVSPTGVNEAMRVVLDTNGAVVHQHVSPAGSRVFLDWVSVL